MFFFCFTENLSQFDLVMKAASRIESTPLGQLMSQIEGTDIQQVIKSYVRDFVHMAYPVKSESEHLVIIHFIVYKILLAKHEARQWLE